MSTRKTLQLITVDKSLVVLADDHTLWQLEEGGWVQLPGLPQQEKKPPPSYAGPAFATMD